MADAHGDLSSVSNVSDSLNLDENSSLNLDRYLSYNSVKKRFSWNGSLEELEQFIKDRFLQANDGVELTKSCNASCAVLKLPDATFNFYRNTRTLQVQGRAIDEVKGFLEEIVNNLLAESLNEEETEENVEVQFPAPRPSDTFDDNVENGSVNVSQNCGTTLDDNDSPAFAEPVTKSVFTKELDKLWFEIESLRVKYFQKDKDKDKDNNQYINTLKQKNKDLAEEICILKARLDQEIDSAKKIAEERDSLKIALQIISKDIINLNNLHNNGGGVNEQTTERTTETKRTEDQRWYTVGEKAADKRETQQQHAGSPLTTARECPSTNTSNGNVNNITTATTVILGDSIIKNIQGYKLGKQVGERVVVKSFAGATSSEMTHYIQPTLERKPQRIVLHIGTNDLRNSSPEKVADNIVDLAREIEMKSDAKVIISELTTRTDKLSDESAVKSTNKRLRRFCNQNNWKLIQHNNITKQGLNKGGLHLNEAGNSKMFENFVKALDGRQQ